MMSNNRGDYASASEWLSVLRKDGLWLSQLQQLQDPAADTAALRATAMRKIGQGETFEFWDSYQHQVEPVVMEVWEIRELTLPKLKIQTIGMLSIEWLEQHEKKAEKVKGGKEQKKAVSKKSQKPRETMTFKRKSGVTDGHLILLYQKLIKEEWIEGNEADFMVLFAGKRDEDCQLIWTGKYGKGTLVELFRQLMSAGLIIVADGYTLPAILEGHFKDKTGAWLTGLDKGDAANNKALPVIQECVKLLKTDVQRLLNGDYDDDEDFQSKYDEYDQQDMHWHKR